MNRRANRAGVVFSFALLSTLASAQSTSRISLTSSNLESDGGGSFPSISADGRFIAFHSVGATFVANDNNGSLDVFLRDRLTGQTTLVSADPSGAPGNSASFLPALSADGRFVAFVSQSRNLVAGDTNGARDIFVRDLQAGVTVRVSVDSSGHQGDGDCYRPSISADGRYVAFPSEATNLVPGDTNGTTDIFVHDLHTGATVRVSVGSSGAQANGPSDQPSISGDGRYVAFESIASNLTAGDTNGVGDVFVHDLVSGRTARVSFDSAGSQAHSASTDPCLSADGRLLAFVCASPLVPHDTNGVADVFVRDLRTGSLACASVDSSGAQADGASSTPVFSPEGRFVAFDSDATNLVAGDANGFQDVFVHDLLSGETVQASVDSTGTEGDAASGGPSLSGGASSIAFWSSATNLVANDTNDALDAFLHDRAPTAPIPFCFGDGSAAPCPCGNSGSAGSGCENSFHTGGGVLAASGSASLSADSLLLVSLAEPPAAASAFLQASAPAPPARLGDGLRCLGGSLRRLYLETSSLGVATAPQPNEPRISARSAALGDAIPLGATRFYQVLYRDPSPAFCPAPTGGTWNLTSGISVVWFP